MKLADNVLHRIVQIVQEGILMGIDVADLMRRIEVVPDVNDPQTLTLDPAYVASVEQEHVRAVSEVEELRRTSSESIVFD